MIKQLTAFREGKNFSKVALFSGHDSNLYAILAAFGVLTEDCLLENFRSYTANKTLTNPNCYFPFFASNLIIELYNTTVSPTVRFYYNNALISLCNGKPECTLDEFITFARKATGNINLIGFLLKCGAPSTSTELPETEVLKEKPTETGQNPDKMIIMGLVTLCALLLAKILYDNKKSAKTIQGLKEELVSYHEFSRA